MLVKSASLCDDCYKTAEKQCHEQLTQSAMKVCPATPTTSVSTVINKKPINDASSLSSTTTIETVPEIVPDDDGYCEIDEIRLPAINKSPSIKRPAVVADPRRKSAAAPLPIEPKDTVETSTSKTNSTDDATATTTPSNEHKKQSTDHQSDEQILNATSPSSSSISLSSSTPTTIVPGKLSTDAIDHIDQLNCAYDSLAQPMSGMCLNSESQLKSACNAHSQSDTNLIDAQPSPTQCHLMLKLLPYVTSLNLHISQLLVRLFLLLFLHLLISNVFVSFAA